MPQIHSSAEYSAYMALASERAMTFCLQKCHEDLIKCMERDLYGAYTPTDYARTNKMLRAWETEAQSKSGAIWFVSPNYPSLIGGESLGDAILDVLESGYRGLNAKTGKEIPARPFWTKWLQRADKMVGKWYAQGLRVQGLTVSGE